MDKSTKLNPSMNNQGLLAQNSSEDEKWTTIVGFPTSIQISSLGRLRELLEGQYPKFLKTSKSGNYEVFSFRGVQYRIHQLVAHSFLSDRTQSISDISSKYVVRHKNGDTFDNRVSNLAYEPRSKFAENLRRKNTSSEVYCSTYNVVFANVATAARVLRIPEYVIKRAMADNEECFGLHLQYCTSVPKSMKDQISDAQRVYYSMDDMIQDSKKFCNLQEYDKYLDSLIFFKNM